MFDLDETRQLEIRVHNHSTITDRDSQNTQQGRPLQSEGQEQTPQDTVEMDSSFGTEELSCYTLSILVLLLIVFGLSNHFILYNGSRGTVPIGLLTPPLVSPKLANFRNLVTSFYSEKSSDCQFAKGPPLKSFTFNGIKGSPLCNSQVLKSPKVTFLKGPPFAIIQLLFRQKSVFSNLQSSY